MYQLGQLRKNDSLYFIDMELCEFTLEQYLCGAVTQMHLVSWDIIRSDGNVRLATEVYGIVEDIMNGLVFIHDLHEVHRDLSPQNGENIFSRMMA